MFPLTSSWTSFTALYFCVVLKKFRMSCDKDNEILATENIYFACTPTHTETHSPLTGLALFADYPHVGKQRCGQSCRRRLRSLWDLPPGTMFEEWAVGGGWPEVLVSIWLQVSPAYRHTIRPRQTPKSSWGTPFMVWLTFGVKKWRHDSAAIRPPGAQTKLIANSFLGL